jgi:RNA polymerase sigma-70 factor (ECF subfamily)
VTVPDAFAPAPPEPDGTRDGTTQKLEQLEAALATLPRFTREIFLAHRIDDLDYDEISRRTGVSVHRIEREIARAICGLDRAFHNQCSAGVAGHDRLSRSVRRGGSTLTFVLSMFRFSR